MIMEIIRIHHPYTQLQIPKEDLVLVLGFFDGVHRGHQELIRRGRIEANERQCPLAVMTFNQHPSIVFQKTNPNNMQYLTTLDQKIAHMERLDVDILFIVDFTSAFASLSPQAFVDQYMVGLHAKVVVAGFDYTYGPRDIATMENLPKYAQDRFSIICVEEQLDHGDKISSTAIRQSLDAGQLEQTNRLLGYTYEIEGIVIHGDARGRTLGFPTANVEVASTTHLPKLGVYAVKMKVGPNWYNGMAQIGHNITFGTNRKLTVEVNILDFDADIYGEQVKVAWYHYLREEVKFSGRDGLIKQLEEDRENTRNYFNQHH